MFIREIPLAHMLGYVDVEDFRRAVAAGNVPAPDQYLGPKKKKPIWDQEKIDLWLGRRAQSTVEDTAWDAIKQVA